MKFIYKINSGYDGFRPASIPDRLDGQSLHLGWKRYVDALELGDEIWVYFLGPHRFTSGVYARGIADQVDYENREVRLRVAEFSTTSPLTDRRLSEQLAVVVSARYQQVFVLPDELDTAPACDLTAMADSCKARSCGSCPTWKQLPIVDRGNLLTPKRLEGYADAFAPGFWSIPSRSYLYKSGKTIQPGIVRTSDIFYRFKTGERSLAFPLALATHKALARAKRLDFDAIVPVPLSPDKERAGEMNRTLMLAKELGRLLEAPVRGSWLELTKPLSKKRLRVQRGLSASAFENAYRSALSASASISGASILLVDDVCTEGSTLRVCSEALWAEGRNVVAATGAQMAVKPVIRKPELLWTN